MKQNNQNKNFFRDLKNVFLFNKKGNGQLLESPITGVIHIGIWDRFINFMKDLGKGTQLRIALVGGGVFVSLGITAFPITNNNGTSNSSATIKNNWTSNSKLTASDLNNNFSSIIETLGNIPNWTKNGSDTYYTAGRVGIGTTSPGSSLDVSGTAQLRGSGSTTGLVVNNLGKVGIGTNPDNSASLTLGGSGNGVAMIIQANATLAGINSAGQAESFIFPRFDNASYLNFGQNGFFIRNNSSQNIMTMINNGNVGIGTTSPFAKLQIEADGSGTNTPLRLKPYTGGANFLEFVNAASGHIAWSFNDGATNRNLAINRYNSSGTFINSVLNISNSDGSISIPGSLTVAGSNVTSDERLKKNIEPLSKNIDLISQLHPVKFQWKDSKAPGMKGIQYGFIAQEIEKIFPSLVVTDDRGYKAVSYISIVPMLVHSFQEQKSNQNQLGTEVEMLANKMKKEKDEFSSKYSTLLDEQISLKRENIELKKQLSETQKQLTDLKKENADFKLSVMQQFKVLEENRYAKR